MQNSTTDPRPCPWCEADPCTCTRSGEWVLPRRRTYSLTVLRALVEADTRKAFQEGYLRDAA